MLWIEPFFNLDLIDSCSNWSDLKIICMPLKHHSNIFKPTNKWDNNSWTTYFNVIQKNKKTYMYYRANLDTKRTDYHLENTCVLISDDGGYTFNQPQLKLFDFHNNTNNNIIWKSDNAISHNFNSFYNFQTNNLQAIGGCNAICNKCRSCANGIYLLESEDGIHWKKNKVILSNTHSVSQGYTTLYDSMNTIVWDEFRNQYRAFLRFNHSRGVRCIQSCVTNDLHNWIKSELCHYKGNKNGYYYTPTVCSYGSNGYFLGFPCCQQNDNRNSQVIDLLFSRDGIHWDIIKNKWLDNNSVSPERMIPTILISKDNKENLIYINNAKNTSVDLYTIRKNGLVAITSSESKEIWFQTKPIYMSNNIFYINFQLFHKGYINLFFYQVNNDMSISKFLLDQHIHIDNHNEIDHKIILSNNVIHKYISIKFVIYDCNLYTFSYHTDKTKVILPSINTSEYKNIKHLIPKSPSSNKNKPSKKQVKPPIEKPIEKSIEKPIEKSIENHIENKTEIKLKVKTKTKQKPKPITSSLDLSHLINLNQRLHNNALQKIQYLYFDLKISNSNPSQREFKFKKPVSEITNFKYSKFNPVGGGNTNTYGRTLIFTVIYTDKTKEEIVFINNHVSNCKVEFI